jgi:uncharacterized membrane protein
MRKWIPPVIVVIAVIASIVVYPALPERMPTHWNMSGQPDGWSSRLWGAWMIPLLMSVIWLIMRALPHIDPRRANYAKFAGMYDALIIATMVFMLGAHVLVLVAAQGTPVAMGRIIIAGVGAFFIVTGVLLPRVHPNWFIGIRTPWTLSSNRSWEKTHKAGGPLFVLAGAMTLAFSAVAPGAATWVLFVSVTAVVVYLFAYSYLVWKKDPARRTVRSEW